MLRQNASIILLLVLASAVFLLGINWGLPSSRVNAYLFGSRAVWSGKQILELTGAADDPDRGADVASHPAADRSRAIVVNATDADRARIVRRYRLMSYQPDEWNTLKALSEMKPGRGQLDPKLYQYGGLWVYPVGAMLKVASMLGYIDLRSDMAWYLDHPEAFGRFYVVARLWSVFWGLVGAGAVYMLMRRIVGQRRYALFAGACFIFMPVVVNMAHEAKPHLAGTALMLLAVLGGAKYVETGRRKDALVAGALCGAAVAMVLSSMCVFVILPVMVVMRRRNASAFASARMPAMQLTQRQSIASAEADPTELGGEDAGEGQGVERLGNSIRLDDRPLTLPSPPSTGERGLRPRARSSEMALGEDLSGAAPHVLRPLRVDLARLAAALLVGVGVYVASNPYVLINFAFHRQVLESNLGNSKAMYHPALSFEGLGNAAYLIAAGTSPILAIAGAVGAVALGLRAWRHRRETSGEEMSRRATGLLLAATAVCVLAQCLLVAKGKPGEFGRFMLLGDVFLMIEAVAALATFARATMLRRGVGAALVVSTAIYGGAYLRGFVRDSWGETSRDRIAGVVALRLREDRMMQAPVSGCFEELACSKVDPALRSTSEAASLGAGRGMAALWGDVLSGPVLEVSADPAPYCLPPVDIFRWMIVLPPKGGGREIEPGVDVSIDAVAVPPRAGRWGGLGVFWPGTPISWADKPFEVRVAR